MPEFLSEWVLLVIAGLVVETLVYFAKNYKIVKK